MIQVISTTSSATCFHLPNPIGFSIRAKSITSTTICSSKASSSVSHYATTTLPSGNAENRESSSGNTPAEGNDDEASAKLLAKEAPLVASTGDNWHRVCWSGVAGKMSSDVMCSWQVSIRKMGDGR